MAHEFRMTRTVEFADTDLAGIVHWAHFFRYMEATEHAFFRSLGFSIHARFDGRQVGWPRVHADCDFIAPLRFEDDVEIHLLVEQVRAKSIVYRFKLHRVIAEGREEVGSGSITSACVVLDREPGRIRSIPIPQQIREQIEAAPPEVLRRFD